MAISWGRLHYLLAGFFSCAAKANMSQQPSSPFSQTFPPPLPRGKIELPLPRSSALGNDMKRIAFTALLVLLYRCDGTVVGEPTERCGPCPAHHCKEGTGTCQNRDQGCCNPMLLSASCSWVPRSRIEKRCWESLYGCSPYSAHLLHLGTAIHCWITLDALCALLLEDGRQSHADLGCTACQKLMSV